MELDAKMQALVDSGKFRAHEEVIELIEVYLEHAKKSPYGAVAICLVGHPNICAADYAGEISLEESLNEGMEKLRAKLLTSIDAWTLPPRNESLDESYVVYNIANGPLGFDFLVFLIDAEMKRVAAGASAPLKVAFWIGKDWQQRINRDKRKMWLENVFRPALRLIGAVEEERALHGSRDPICVSRDIVKASRAGQAVPLFRSPVSPTEITANGATQPFKDYITITLREAEHWAERNSRVEEWVAFAKYLQSQGERVLFIRDTAKADEPIPGFGTIPAASKDLLWRMAVYERAKANLFTSNGPVTLAVFSRRPWLQFISPPDELSPYTANRPEFWIKSQGIAPGDQYPWSAPNQRIVWADDTYDNLVAAWHEYIQPAAKAA